MDCSVPLIRSVPSAYLTIVDMYRCRRCVGLDIDKAGCSRSVFTLDQPHVAKLCFGSSLKTKTVVVAFHY